MDIIEVGNSVRRLQKRGERNHVYPPLRRSVEPLCAEITRTVFRRKQSALIDIQPTPFSGKIGVIFLLANIGRIEAAGELNYPFLAVNFNMRLGAGTAARTAEAVNFIERCVVGVII